MNSSIMQARPVEYDLYASGAITVSPDPQLISMARRREQQATTDLGRLAQRRGVSALDFYHDRRKKL